MRFSFLVAAAGTVSFGYPRKGTQQGALDTYVGRHAGGSIPESGCRLHEAGVLGQFQVGSDEIFELRGGQQKVVGWRVRAEIDGECADGSDAEPVQGGDERAGKIVFRQLGARAAGELIAPEIIVFGRGRRLRCGGGRAGQGQGRRGERTGEKIPAVHVIRIAVQSFAGPRKGTSQLRSRDNISFSVTLSDAAVRPNPTPASILRNLLPSIHDSPYLMNLVINRVDFTKLPVVAYSSAATAHLLGKIVSDANRGSEIEAFKASHIGSVDNWIHDDVDGFQLDRMF